VFADPPFRRAIYGIQTEFLRPRLVIVGLLPTEWVKNAQ